MSRLSNSSPRRPPFHPPPPRILKRIGAFAGDGTTNVRAAPGQGGDYVDDYGTEGMMLLYP